MGLKAYCEEDERNYGGIPYPCVRGHLYLDEDGKTRCYKHHDAFLRVYKKA